MKVLIPAAKVVEKELQSIGMLPAIIYPINKKIVFDYLYNQYNAICDSLDIICYEKADKVHRRLKNYHDSRIHICDLPELGDLGQTVYFGLSDEDEPVLINFADTIVMESMSDIEMDTFYYSEDFVSSTWTYFKINEGIITDIHDKEEAYVSDKREKLFIGVFMFSSSKLLKSCLREAVESRKQEGINSFYRALQLYSERCPLKAVRTEKWFDIGHIDKYYNTKLEVKAREFNHISIDKDRGILKKTSDDKDKFIGEIKWYLKLPADIEYVRPRIFDYSTSYVAPYVDMEYYAYHTVHELYLYGDLKYNQWHDLFSRIKFICSDFKRYTLKDEKIRESLEDMYLRKTMQRFQKLSEDKRFSAFFEKQIQINGRKFISLTGVIELLKNLIPSMLYDVNEFCIIHGDLCFANMMVDSNCSFVKVIDPRGKFGKYDIYGDSRYELAKLFHSLDGKYDYIIKDLFTVEYDTECAVIDYTINTRVRDYDLFELFKSVFSDEIKDDFDKIVLIEALLFLSMIPLHGESFDHQIVMLATGMELLARVSNKVIL
ncbi:capsular biosynthesis protein [Enterococcus faecium]|uniref:capsular biosynthesis protein n=1 Tax=Enterococcus faecium TaxID=1352 RepID=UPI002650FCA9|nr:capsular biosynthesis protein [Enterococcus faecium]MDN6965943.1 capsular biosynthesis protein [Enterococcus faecium]